MNPFDGPRLKIQRAKRHLADVQSEIELFLNRRPYRLIVEADANPNFQRVVMRQVAAIIRLMGLDDARRRRRLPSPRCFGATAAPDAAVGQIHRTALGRGQP